MTYSIAIHMFNRIRPLKISLRLYLVYHQEPEAKTHVHFYTKVSSGR